MTSYRVLSAAHEVDDHVLVLVTNCVEDRFPPDEAMPTDEFIDRLCESYAEGWDIEQLDTPAVRKIMRHARAIRREMI
jgi:hypothetical protein